MNVFACCFGELGFHGTVAEHAARLNIVALVATVPTETVALSCAWVEIASIVARGDSCWCARRFPVGFAWLKVPIFALCASAGYKPRGCT